MNIRRLDIRRQFVIFIVAQVIFAAALFWSGSNVWIEEFPDPGLGGLRVGVAETGAQIIPLIPVASVVALIAVLGVLATGAWGRRIIGTATAIVAFATALATASVIVNFSGAGRDGIAGWLVLVVALSGGLVLTSLSAVIIGGHWPQLGKKYQRDQPEGIPIDPWKALDQGIDPTVDHGDNV